MMPEPDITVSSPNHDNALLIARTVIIHATRSSKSMNPVEFEGTLNWFQMPISQSSSHWVLARDGRKARVIPDLVQAWHAGEDNDNAWGIELEQGVEQDGFTTVQLGSLLSVCRAYIADFGVPPVHGIPGFIGHQETNQGKRNGKSDPGYLFPWEWFMSELQQDANFSGVRKEGTFLVAYNDGVPVWRWGSTDGLFPGRISKLFGDSYLWLRTKPYSSNTYWSTQEGD